MGEDGKLKIVREVENRGRGKRKSPGADAGADGEGKSEGGEGGKERSESTRYTPAFATAMLTAEREPYRTGLSFNKKPIAPELRTAWFNKRSERWVHGGPSSGITEEYWYELGLVNSEEMNDVDDGGCGSYEGTAKEAE